jgi:zinc transporter ZupT
MQLDKGATRRQVLSMAAVLVMLIPLAAAGTLLLPVTSTRAAGTLLGASAGALVYIGATHLLPEIHADNHRRAGAGVFAEHCC